MKILMTLESAFPPDKRVENEIETLYADGHEIGIICLQGRTGFNTNTYKKARIYYLNPGPIIRKSSVAALKIPLYFSFWKRKIKRILKSENYDAVHVHDLPLIKPVSELREIFNFRIILDLHENWPGLLDISPHTKTFLGRILCSMKQWKEYEKKYLQKADKLIVVVKEAKQRLLELNPDFPEIHIVSNTINIDETGFAERKIYDGDNFILVYEGGISYHRGLQNIISALSELPDLSNRLQLWVIGSGSYLKKLKAYVKKLHIQDQVDFRGWMPLSEIYTLLAKADMALIPHLRSSHSDSTIPHKLFHYMHMNLPILSSDCLPLKRIIEETRCGICYSSDSLSDLKTKIEYFANNPMALNEYSKSRRFTESTYNWSVDSKELTSLYIKIDENK